MAHVYHWKHGWIPLDHVAALSKAKGNHERAASLLSAAHGSDTGIHSSQHVAKASLDLPSIADHTDRAAAKAEIIRAADHLDAHDSMPAAWRSSARVSVRPGSYGGESGHHITGTDARGRKVAVFAPGDRAAADKAAANIRAGRGAFEQDHTRSAELAAAAMQKRAEFDRIAGNAGVGDRAAGRLDATALGQFHRNTDSQLQRAVAAQHAAENLDHKAGLARARETEAARVRLTHDQIKGATHVKDAHGWHEVVRVNGKTVTVKTPHSWTDSIPHDKVHAVRRLSVLDLQAVINNPNASPAVKANARRLIGSATAS